MPSQPRFTLLVNSCDAYEDCWIPFFTLLSRNWSDLAKPIILNTESKSFCFPGLDVKTTHELGVIGINRPWAARLASALECVKTEFVLMMLDDFFIRRQVRADAIDEIIQIMADEKYNHVMLNEPHRPFQPTTHSMLVMKGRKSQYRLSLQAGIWRPKALRRYLRTHENPWQTEIYGTWRSWRMADTLLALNPEYVSAVGLPIEYDLTGGIARGRWYREKVEALFNEHRLVVDFGRRGWYRPGVDQLPKRPIWRRAIDRLRSSV